MTHRERVLAAFNCQPVDRVPFSLWHHFLPHEEAIDALADPSILDTLYEGHKKHMELVQPDFVKVMCDGLFRYPCEGFTDFKSYNDFDKMKALDANHPWIRAHVKNAAQVVSIDPDVVYEYNVFSPTILFRLLNGQEAFMDSYKNAPQKMSDAMNRIGDGILTQVECMMKEGGIDGIYYCVQNQDLNQISDEDYEKYFLEADKKVMAAANAINDCSILHICGYAGKHNRVASWKGFDAKVMHWAGNVEGINLAEGKKIFGDHCVLGGLGNQEADILNVGTEAEIKAYVKQIVADTGREGLVVGPDCALPFNIDRQHLVWVREALEELG